jgi:heme exporter protein C
MTDSRALRLAAAVGTLALLGAGAMIFVYAPRDALQGDVQRIFYLHVSAAIAAYAAFAVVLVGGLVYLWRSNAFADRVARCAAEIGLLMTTVCLVMGMLWAKPIWGVFWTWDARLTSTLVLWMIYAGYLLVRRVAAPGRQAARLAAVVGIVGFVDVPIVHFSVTWWRTLHPGPVIEAANGPQLPPEMLYAFAVTAVSVLFFTGVLIAVRYQLEKLFEAAEQLRAEVAEPQRVPVLAAR